MADYGNKRRKEKSKPLNIAAGKTMPHSAEAEDAVIGAFLTDNEICLNFNASLRADDFYSKANRTLFECIKELAGRNVPVDIVTVTGKLEKDGTLEEVGGVTRLEELTDTLPSAANCEYYIDIVKRDALMRKIIEASSDTIDNAFSLDDAQRALALAEAAIYEIGVENQRGELVPISEPTLNVVDRLAEVFRTKKPASGLMTHYRNLDKITNGFLPGQMLVIAARPGCGKTSFAMSMATNIAKYDPDKVIAVFNLEMSAEELVQRMIVSLTGVPSATLVKGEETQEELQRLFEAQDRLSNSKIFIDDTASLTAEEIMSKCRRLKMKQKRLDLIIIDYLQLMGASKDRSGNRQQEVADTSRLVKMMAKELEVPIILLSQMSRDIEKRDDKTPMLSDLRESGAIEQDADMVMFLSDANEGQEIADNSRTNIEMRISKHRNGATGSIYFIFDKSKMRFSVAVNKGYVPKENGENAQPQQENAPNEFEEVVDSYDDYDAPLSDADAPQADQGGAYDAFDMSDLQDSVDINVKPGGDE